MIYYNDYFTRQVKKARTILPYYSLEKHKYWFKPIFV